VRRLLLTLLAIAVFGLYVLTNQINVGRPAITLDMPIDHWIPRIPAGMAIYLSVYVFLFVPVAQIRHFGTFKAAAFAFCVFNLLGILVFTYFPVMVVREPLEIRNVFDWGLAFNYAFDPPYNSFPSLHVANAFFASLIARKLDRPVGNICLVVAVAVVLSTLVTKQHWVADALAGAPLGWAGYYFIVRPAVPVGATREELTFPRWYLAALAGGYGLVFVFFLTGYTLGWKPF
jgi:membrane-associated phospholipid phosphatase